MNWRVNFNWKLTLFVVFFLPLLLKLGFWQLSRAEEKQLMLTAQAELSQQPAITIEQLTAAEIVNYRPVQATGEFLNKTWLLDNQMLGGKFGYEVLHPFKLKSGELILVSRGWVEGSLYRDQLPQITIPKNKVTIVGYLYQPTEAYALEKELENKQWPKVIQHLDVQNMYKAVAGNARISSPFLMRLAAGDSRLLKAHWQIINVQPERHTAYAYQWFGMAILLIGLYVWASIKKENG